MHWLTLFGSVDLPQYDANFNAGPAPAVPSVVSLVGGGIYDADGTASSRQRYPLAIRYNCTVVGPSAVDARTRMDALKAMIGTRAKLWRTLVDDGATHWAWARLSDVDDTMRSRLPKWNIPATLEFTRMDMWHGVGHRAPWVLDDGEYLDDGLYLDCYDLYTLTSSPQPISIENGGNIAVRDALLRITAGSSAITALQVRVVATCNLRFTGTIQPGEILEIDCGKRSVLNDGANAYSDFELTASHVVSDWMLLEPGENSIIVSWAGGGTGSTIEFVFADGWA